MTQRKEFVIDSGVYALMGDERGVLTNFPDRDEVWAWAESNGITMHYQGSIAQKDLWYINDEQQRAWFLLRWS